MKTSLITMLSLAGLSANASIMTYELDSKAFEKERALTGLFSVYLGLSKPSESSHTKSYLKSAEMKKLKAEGLTKKCEKTHSGGISLYGVSGARYSCLMKTYDKAIAEYEAKLPNVKKSRVLLDLKGFTRSYGKVYGNTTFTNEAGLYPRQEYLIQFDINSCLDRYGSWWTKHQDDIEGETKLEKLVDALFSETLQDYVRCDLRLTTMTDKTSNTGRGVFESFFEGYGDIKLSIEEDSRTVYVNQSYYSRDASRYDAISSANISDDYDEVRLRDAIEAYGNFLKFDYGLILSEIGMNELSNAEAQLKIQSFLSKNRGKIKKLVLEIDESIESAPFFKKISAGFYLSSVYGHISNIEKSLNSRLTLDHILRTFH